MLRQRHSRFAGDACTLRGGVDDKHQRFAVVAGDIDRGPDGAQIVRRRTRRQDHNIGMADDIRDRFSDCRRSVDDREADIGTPQML